MCDDLIVSAMPWRTYTIIQKYTKVDGSVSIYKVKNRKKIHSNKPYTPQKRGLGKKSIRSSRFGFLDLYNRREQQELICPSGYSISQCFNVLRKTWYGYRRALGETDLGKMEKYAKAIQSVQNDMGIKITSFPHLGIYGDQFTLNNKNGERIVSENHSALKEKNDEYDRWAAENPKKVQEEELKPDVEKGEEIISIVDTSYRIKRKARKNLIPDALVPDEDKGQELITVPDEIPFRD
jgi:hypothetical protein